MTRDPTRRPAPTMTEAEVPVVDRPILEYAGWDVLSQQDHWDDATRRLILRRVHQIPPIRFFDASDVRTLTALAERVLPQNDRAPDRRIPLVPWIDQRCYDQIVDGWRYEDLPQDGEAWRMGLRGLDETALARFKQRFADLDGDREDDVLRLIAEGNPPGAVWQGLPARRFWIHIVLRQLCGVYYAHPLSWDEIGFGGPAYPRGYFALNHGFPEPWEAREVR